MSLLELQNHLAALLDKANQKGAFNLQDSNTAIMCLNELAKAINQQQQVSTMSESDPTNPPIPHDPSKP